MLLLQRFSFHLCMCIFVLERIHANIYNKYTYRELYNATKINRIVIFPAVLTRTTYITVGFSFLAVNLCIPFFNAFRSTCLMYPSSNSSGYVKWLSIWRYRHIYKVYIYMYSSHMFTPKYAIYQDLQLWNGCVRISLCCFCSSSNILSLHKLWQIYHPVLRMR